MESNGIKYHQYLSTLTKEFKKLAKLEFLQPDNSVAFTLDNNYKRGYKTKYDTRAFIQSGSLSVSLQNGKRRSASVTLSNLDGAFDYAINKIWFGQRVRLSMGLVLPDGTDFYLPQGVFYISNPSVAYKPEQRTVTYNLVDKWAYLDGSLFGTLDNSYKIERTSDKPENTIWGAMRSLLTLSKIDFEQTSDNSLQVDNVTPVFTTYYDDKKYNVVVSDDLENASVSDGYITVNGDFAASPTDKTLVISCKPKTKYTFTKKAVQPIANDRLRIAESVTQPQVGDVFTNWVNIGEPPSAESITITTTENAKFLVVTIGNFTSSVTTPLDEIKKSCKLYAEVNMTDIPYEIKTGGDNATLANVMLELNDILVGWIGYDQTGALRVDASQDDIEDNKKPVQWNFTPENSQLLGVSETFKNGEVYNDVLVVGQSIASKEEIYGRASNYDPKSDTNIFLIGRRTYKESRPNYSNTQQCIDLAQFRLKRKTVLQKSVTIESSQIFHLTENNVVTVKRTDKPNSPTERHLIQSYTLPIGEMGSMFVNCVSVNDLPELITKSKDNNK